MYFISIFLCLSYIHSKLKNEKINEDFNTVILSDHGTAPISHSNIMKLNDIINETNDIQVINSGPIVFINTPDKGNNKTINQFKQ